MSGPGMPESASQVAWALSIVGDRWTLLIMRELRLGSHRFEEIHAQTGISSHLLCMRLKRMEADGIVARCLYQAHPPRYQYGVTAMGRQLDDVLLALRNWALAWGPWPAGHPPAVTLRDRATGALIGRSSAGAAVAWPFSFDDVEVTLSEVFRQERAARTAAFRRNKRKSKKARD